MLSAHEDLLSEGVGMKAQESPETQELYHSHPTVDSGP